MLSSIIELINILAVFFGIYLGEITGIKLFGFRKKWQLIESILIILLIFGFSRIIFPKILAPLIFFFISLFSVLLIRGIVTVFGLFGEKINKKIERDKLLGLYFELRKEKIEKNKILNILERVGFNTKELKKEIEVLEKNKN